MLFASNAEVALRSTADRSRLLAAITGIQPGAGATRYGPALKLAGSILSESALPRREAILITDFQRTGWQGAEGVRLPDGSELTPVSVGDSRNQPTCRCTPVSLAALDLLESAAGHRHGRRRESRYRGGAQTSS